MLSPDARDGSLKVFQDMTLWRWALKSQEASSYQTQQGRHLWIQVVRGTIDVNGQQANTSDALAIWDEDSITVRASEDSEILLFDLPPVK